MATRVALIHDNPAFSGEVVQALRAAGYDVVLFADPMDALDALEQNTPLQLLITRVQFPTRKPNGVAIARMVRVKWPAIKVLIVGQPDFAKFAEGVAGFLPLPVSNAQVVAAADSLLSDGVLQQTSTTKVAATAA